MGTDVSAEFCVSVFREEERGENVFCREETGTGAASELVGSNDLEPVVKLVTFIQEERELSRT
jgi:hypothetical protein